MEEALTRKKEVIPELKEAYKRAKARSVEAQAAKGQADKVDVLKDELAWAYVGEKEDVRMIISFFPSVDAELSHCRARAESQRRKGHPRCGDCQGTEDRGLG